MDYAIVDYRISEEEKCNLKKLGCEVLVCPPSKLLYDAICGHPDVLLHIIDNENLMVHKDMNVKFVKLLKKLGFNVSFSENNLNSLYPYDIILNAVNLSNLFIHNIKYTDSELLKKVSNKKLINVKQGYTKCSTAIVSEKAIMTSDKNIAKTLFKENIDVLLLPPGDILLPGLDYGFIGGCCGLLDYKLLAFYGDLNYYTYGKKVLEFLKKHSIEPVFLRKEKLIDRGSLFIARSNL
ncbi:hypothetical protein JMF89_10705 [Clostridiaceae bacterium UIB06]|uniref:DUF6873 domain-containing protein n=1 Tax=Clostridium thailandense TaxID=2794346 RepID=A0A949TXN4_9CLOT|nr:hypothetical protein [Clostridium thailandense]MBV7272788.1 hypothetical protein [Clostridium thailandense]MCH5137671.1 hypothetical protein [Clostridiaceae bacterium UIB06]